MLSQILDYDVIIVGAGISGLAAAHQLLSKEGTLRILILEAADRIGGQAVSISMEGAGAQQGTFDIGAHWISINQTHTLQIINTLDLDVAEQYKNGLVIGEYKKSENHAGTFIFDFLSDVAKLELYQFLSKINVLSCKINFMDSDQDIGHTYLEGVNMEDYMLGHLMTPTARRAFRTHTRITCGNELSDISVLYYLAFCNSTLGLSHQLSSKPGGAKEYYILGGADQIARNFAEKIGNHYIKLSEEVVTITQDFDNVQVVTRKNQYRCTYAILAISLEELSSIDFIPNLPIEISYLLDEFNDSSVLQFTVTYANAFWKNMGCSGEVFSIVGPIQYACDCTINDMPALTGSVYIAGGMTTNNEDYTSEKNIRKSILEHLSRIFGPDMLTPIQLEFKIFPSPKPIGAKKWKALKSLRSRHGRIFFGGAETATMWRNYLSGGIQAGQRCALQALLELRPQTITAADIHAINPTSCQKYHLNRKHNFMERVTSHINYYSILGIIIFTLTGIMIHRFINQNT